MTAWALVNINDDRAAKALTTVLKTKDLVVIASAYSFFIQRGEPGSESILINILNRHGDEIMAVLFLSCGNSQLAARTWVSAHRYKISGSPVKDSSKWRSGR